MPPIPSPEDVLRSVVRGRTTRFEVPEGTASIVAGRLRRQLAEQDVLVFAGSSSQCTALRLMGTDEAERIRPELDALVADFRVLARTLSGTTTRERSMRTSGASNRTACTWASSTATPA